MKFRLTRDRAASTGIFGELWSEYGVQVCHTLEHSYDCKPKLPAGHYTCVRGQHELHSGPIETFEITGVPGHAGILFHPGNTQAASEGCVLVGLELEGDAITESRAAFAKFLELTAGLDQFELEVQGP